MQNFPFFSSPLCNVTTIIMYELTMTDGHLKSSPVLKDHYCLSPRAVLEPFSLKGVFGLIRSLLLLLAWWQRQGITSMSPPKSVWVRLHVIPFSLATVTTKNGRQSRSKTVVVDEKRDNHNFRSMEAELAVYSVSGF